MKKDKSSKGKKDSDAKLAGKKRKADTSSSDKKASIENKVTKKVKPETKKEEVSADASKDRKRDKKAKEKKSKKKSSSAK